MKTLTLLVLLLTPGCFAQTEDDAPAPPECTACPAGDEPSAENMTVTEGEGLEKVVCQATRYTCSDGCHHDVYHDCQPAVVLGGPNPGAAR